MKMEGRARPVWVTSMNDGDEKRFDFISCFREITGISLGLPALIVFAICQLRLERVQAAFSAALLRARLARTLKMLD